MSETIKQSINIKKIETIEDFRKVMELDFKVWGGDPVPYHQTLTASKNGGMVLGAFEGDKLVGFLYGFTGFQNGEVYLCSHMMGIDADYRSNGIGYQLKQKQAEIACQMGYKKIRWTFDPLESRNGYLNITKLGSICSEYVEDCYGEMEDGLNKNMPSDRFNVEWLIDSFYLEKRKELFSDLQVTFEGLMLDWHEREDGLPEPIAVDKESFPDSEFLFVPVPVNIQELKQNDADLALDWRLKTRAVFQLCFSKGWTVVHVLRQLNEKCQYYVLCKRDKLEL